jgi:MFS family permease
LEIADWGMGGGEKSWGKPVSRIASLDRSVLGSERLESAAGNPSTASSPIAEDTVTERAGEGNARFGRTSGRVAEHFHGDVGAARDCLKPVALGRKRVVVHTLLASALTFVSGFIIMVLEIIGARFLARDFGNTFHIWVGQIGVVLTALAVGYYVGGNLADRWQRAAPLSALLGIAGCWLLLTPMLAPRVTDWLILRHPREQPIPPVWQKLDPALGSFAVFFIPCLALAALSPAMIRLGSRQWQRLGRTSGQIIAANTVGSVGGVFIAGFVLIEHLRLSQIFVTMGALTLLLAALCLVSDRLLSRPADTAASSTPHNDA